ncbi:unnamed protein product, partial [Callosobruchus maculatus]
RAIRDGNWRGRGLIEIATFLFIYLICIGENFRQLSLYFNVAEKLQIHGLTFRKHIVWLFLAKEKRGYKKNCTTYLSSLTREDLSSG